ncbi:fam-a protein [Plasmodium vinckei lentum]|uniref:Fam-a protein n=1 Tax=Plasmodium vinckei lentum TaxID=138297 RepID=A0A6V7S2R5_PLAVN|nr:fam-a protein [Plasmodium vinckei lentum]
MNKGYIRLFLFVLSLFMYASNKALANEASLVNDNINNPIQTKNNSGNKPVQKKTTPQDKPVQKKTTSQDKPVQKKTTAQDKPVQKKTTAQDKPVQKKTTPQDKPVQAKDAGSNKPVQANTPSQAKPAQSNTPSQVKPAQANKPLQAQPAASNHSTQANKNVKKSGLSRLGRKISSILLSILEAFACGAPKPKKTGQTAQVRARNTPENDMTKKTTPEKTPEKPTPEKPVEKPTPEKPVEKPTPEKTPEKIPEKTAKNATIDNNAFDALYKNNQHLLCHDPEEIEKVGKLMSGAAALLQKQLESDDYYRTDFSHQGTRILRRQKETDIGKLCITIDSPDKYDEIKNTIWNPNGAQNMDPSFLTGQVVRVYGPNLMMIQQCYTSGGHSSVKYFHYLAQKIEVSKDKTIMVYLSANVTDINDSMEENMGVLLDIAYSLEPGCNYEEEFKKNYVNLSGYDINKDDKKVDITYFDSIYDDDILAPLYGFKRVRSRKFAQLVNLKEKLSKKNKYIPNSTFLLD